MKVALLGATGQTGSVIVKALLRSTTPTFEITALTRPSSIRKPEVLELEKQGVNIVVADLSGPEEELKETLVGVDVVISTIYGGSVIAEKALIDASKAAGVKRYLPCFFATVTPPKGVLLLRDMKEDILNYIKKAKLPYTVVDVGWWYQVMVPRLPSGRIDHAVMEATPGIAGDGNVPFAMSDLQDVGTYVAQIICDPRTINRMVFAYNEVVTYNQLYDMVEVISGEKLPRNYVPSQTIEAEIREVEASPIDPQSVEFVRLTQLQYWYSCGIRGDNTPENAQYLGYLLARDLYPGFRGLSLDGYIGQLLEGKGSRVYEHVKEILSRK